MNKITVLAAALAAAGSLSAADLKVEVVRTNDLWWNAPETPEMYYMIADSAGTRDRAVVRFYVTADTMPSRVLIDSTCTVSLPATLGFPVAVSAPGFYRCRLEADGAIVNETVIGYEPTSVVSLPDAQPDFDAFWQRAKAELAEVPADYTLTELPEKSGKSRKLYECRFRSWGGDTITARIAMPSTPGPHAAIIYYNGYGGGPWDLDTDSPNDLIEMQTSVRGQFLSQEGNRYGDWIRWHLDDPDTYYYKGAFMDALRAIDVLEQLPEVDRSRIYAEGGSQGGALTLVAGALCDGRLRAIAPYIPFLSDFRDYFRIVPWPASAVFEAQKQLGLSDEQLYRNLSYFDMKNFARRIKMPVLMGIGLQDPTCPPHTNMASYNLITSPKELHIYPTCGHTVDYSDWNPRRTEFFERYGGGKQ